MFFAGNRIGQFALVAAACLLPAIAGCGLRALWQRPDPDHDLFSTKISELRPGAYCEIEMVVPPTSPEGSYQCYKGTVREVTQNDVVLTNVVEESQIDYSGSGRHREPTEKKHDVIHVPLTGIDEIWALRPKKNDAAPPTGSGVAPVARSSYPRRALVRSCRRTTGPPVSTRTDVRRSPRYARPFFSASSKNRSSPARCRAAR